MNPKTLQKWVETTDAGKFVGTTDMSDYAKVDQIGWPDSPAEGEGSVGYGTMIYIFPDGSRLWSWYARGTWNPGIHDSHIRAEPGSYRRAWKRRVTERPGYNADDNLMLPKEDLDNDEG